MKKILVPLLVLTLLCLGMTALAEGGDAITLELNTSKLPVYAAGDPYLDGLTEQTDLPVLVIPVKKAYQLSVKVQPQSVKNKKVTLSVDNGDVVKAAGNTVTGKAPGEAVLTIASAQDPGVTIQYRIVVIQPITRITLTPSAKSVAVGGTITLTPVFTPENATRKQVTWSTTTDKLLSVDENGVVTGIKKGNGRVTATAADGSNLRVSININVTQGAEEITLDKPELTVDVGKTAMLKATILPKDTNNKKVSWSSSDEGIAKVNAQGRVQGVTVGECEIVCTSQDNGEVQAKATVHVQQPVKKIVFGAAPNIYKDETAQLICTAEPADATNPVLKFTSSNPKILTVDEDGTLTGISAGDATIIAESTDGSRRKAQLKVRVMQHVTGVRFLRHTAYIDLGTSSSAGVVIEPDKFTNHHMSWESEDDSIASVSQDRKVLSKADIRGNREGTTTVTGTTEDGGFKAYLTVRVGHWDNALRWVNAEIDGRGNFLFRVKNTSDLTITRVVVEVECFEDDGTPAHVNRRDAGNKVNITYNKTLGPGETTSERGWNAGDYDNMIGWDVAKCRIKMFVIDNDWEKWIPANRRPTTQITIY
jgi:uncharacterized protein YjdB